MKFIPRLNLQLHSEGENTSVFGYDTGVSNPLFTEDTTVAETETVVEDITQPGVDGNAGIVVDNVVDSVSNNDKPDAESQATIDFNELKNKIDTILNKVDRPIDEHKPQDEKPKVEETKTQLTAEEIEQMNNDFYLKFTDKPLEAIQELINQRAEEIASQKIAPIKEHFDNMEKMDHWRKEIDNFEASHPDFREMVNEISEVIQSDESIRNAKNPLELAYKVVKSDKLEAKLSKESRPLNEQIKDENTLKELLKDPEIKNMIFKELKTDKEEIPQVIGGKGQTSVNVGDKPKNMRESTKAWLNS